MLENRRLTLNVSKESVTPHNTKLGCHELDIGNTIVFLGDLFYSGLCFKQIFFTAGFLWLPFFFLLELHLQRVGRYRAGYRVAQVVPPYVGVFNFSH